MKAPAVAKPVSAILARVKKDGDKALLFYTRKFDAVALKPSSLRVSKAEIAASVRKLEPALKKALDKAAENVREFHEEELHRLPCSWGTKDRNALRGQIYTPLASAGLYVPGGRFSYPSTVLMTAIPARVAGVEKIVMVTPPKHLTPAVLYAASISGVTEIYRVGGPAAIAALAYGTKAIPRVDIIVGPGNAYVNEAKRQVLGTVGIDSLAGPSEVAILADDTANPGYIAADLLAQTEHDPNARAYLFSDSKKLMAAVKAMLPAAARKQVSFVPGTQKQSLNAINELAPEHLEIMIKLPGTVIAGIKNAGAIFLGGSTPTALGDYWAGPSHVLPTGGTARFSSGLSAATFLKRMSYLYYPSALTRECAPLVEKLAEAEGLYHHRDSVAQRKK